MRERSIDAYLHPVRYIGAGLGQDRDTAVVIADDDTLVLGVGSGQIVVDLAAGSGNGKLVVLNITGAADEVEPVGFLACSHVCFFLRGHPGQVGRIVTRHDSLDPLVGAHDLRPVVPILHASGGVEGEYRFLAAALLCGNHDNAVGGTGTESCGRGRILEDVERGDIVRVDVVHTAHKNRTVNHDEGIAVPGDGSLSTDLHPGASARAVRSTHIKSGNVTLYGFERVEIVCQCDR